MLPGMTPEETVDKFIALVVSGDLDGACELVTDDVEYDNVPMGKNIGPAAMKEFLGQMTGLDEMEFVIHRQVASGNLVLNERVDRFRVGEQWMELPVAGVFEVADDGRIRLWRDYFDMATMTNEMAKLAG
jgi:limonene-1,2-epoxide hydrolase